MQSSLTWKWNSQLEAFPSKVVFIYIAINTNQSNVGSAIVLSNFSCRHLG